MDLEYLYYKYDVVGLTGPEEEEIRSKMPQFLFYRRDKQGIDTYCTSCMERRWAEKADFSGAFKPLAHNVIGICPRCGEQVTYKCMGRGRSSYYAWGNFVMIRAESKDEVHLDCVGVRQYFEEDIMQPQYEAFLKNQYILRPGQAEKWAVKWHMFGGYDWAKTTVLSEPHFSTWVYGYADNSYYVIGHEQLKDTFLKYALCSDDIPSTFVSYLCRFAKHPNIEYLIKGGFANIVQNICQGNAGVYINYRTNDLKKMLRLNREEINLLRNRCIEDYRSFIEYRKHLSGLCTTEIINYWKEYKCIYQDALELVRKYDINDFKKLLDYIGKQDTESTDRSKRVLMHDYCDYIRECSKLKYDLTSRVVLFPKNFVRAHARTTKAMQSLLSAEQQAQLEISNKLRSWLPYTDESRGLTVIVPSTVQEIIDEGAKQNHCVGGYADRHVLGSLHIVFLRKISDSETPYYTMEISKEGRIVQCRGYANNVEHNGGVPKPQEIFDFEREYQSYLNKAIAAVRKKKKKKERRSA